MKKTIFFLLIVTLANLLLYSQNRIHTLQSVTEKKKMDENDYRFFYGICWDGDNASNLSFAKQMGYQYIFYRWNMEKEENATNMHFYLESPEYITYQRGIDRSLINNYDTTFYTRFAALKDASLPFPENMARGWFVTPESFVVVPDFQQQKVIDYMVDSILNYVQRIERPDKNFIFGGYAWDVPQLAGDFWDTIQVWDNKHLGSQITLAYWTGSDSGSRHPDVSHEYKTYSDGHAAFYKALYKKTREQYPNARFIMEPYRIYNNWINEIADRKDAKELMPDILLQEEAGTAFATKDSIYKVGLINRENVGVTAPITDETRNREIAALAAVNGSIFGWSGRFGNDSNGKRYKHIDQIPSWLQLIRSIPGWENKNGTPLSTRKWKNGIYSSPTAYISSEVIYAVQPETGRIFIVFSDIKGIAPFPHWKQGMQIYQTNDMFLEEKTANKDIRISKKKIYLTNPNGVNTGYIIK